MTDSSDNVGSAAASGALETQHIPGGGAGSTPESVHQNHYSKQPQPSDILEAIVAKHKGQCSRNEFVAEDGSQLVRFTHEGANGDRIAGNGTTNMEAALNLKARMEAVNG